jgi:hypothetical protein
LEVSREEVVQPNEEWTERVWILVHGARDQRLTELAIVQSVELGVAGRVVACHRKKEQRKKIALQEAEELTNIMSEFIIREFIQPEENKLEAPKRVA